MNDGQARLFDAAMRLAFFGLMGMGLVVASLLLWFGKLDSADWSLVCSVLFGSDRLGHAVTGARKP